VQHAVDGAIVVAWAVVVGHLGVRAVRDGASIGRVAVGLATFAAAIGLAILLERRSGGPLVAMPALAALGAVLTVTGALAHVRTRERFGTAWSSAPAPRAPAPRDDGPYAQVRHPLYAALAVMLAGTVLAHPSVAVGYGALGMAIGLALKIRREERALAAAFGPRWDAYRARVPCIVPRLRGPSGPPA
jgi:protein-S-isoprenylcysteine O-methyltransferase Ste14